MKKEYGIRLSGIKCLFMFMFLAFVMRNGITVEAASKVIVLKPGKTYKYDLDKDGTKEKIKVSYTNAADTDGSGSSIRTDTLSINGRNVYEIVKISTPIEGTWEYEGKDIYYINGKKKRTEKSKTWGDGSTVFFVTDVDKSDRQMEVLAARGWNIDDLQDTSYRYALPHLWYCGYKKGTFTEKQDLRAILKTQYGKYYSSDISNIHACSDAPDTVFKTDGKGNLFFQTCLYLKDKKMYLDYLHFEDNLVLKNGKFIKETEKEYDVWGDRGTCQAKIKVYADPACKKVQFTLKKMDIVDIDGLYCKNKNTFYLKVRTVPVIDESYLEEDDQVGYVKPGEFKVIEEPNGSNHM